MRGNFTDVKHAHTTTFENNGASHTTELSDRGSNAPPHVISRDPTGGADVFKMETDLMQPLTVDTSARTCCRLRNDEVQGILYRFLAHTFFKIHTWSSCP